MNGQAFFEVFPDFRTSDDLRYTLSGMMVTKVVMRRQEKRLTVHLRGEHILAKKLVNKIAYDLKTQLFGNNSLFLVIDDTYELSPLYTLERLARDYWPSILYETQKMGQIEYSLVKNCEWGVEGNILTLLLEDSFLARRKAGDLKEYLESMFAHRFGKEIQAGFNFSEDAKECFYRARDHKLNLEVGLVMDRIREQERKCFRWNVRFERRARRQTGGSSGDCIRPTFLRRGPGRQEFAPAVGLPRIRILFTEKNVTGRSFPLKRSWMRSDRW